MVHIGPRLDGTTGAAAWLYGSSYGKASVLFVVVAGIGVGLMERRVDPVLVRARLVYRTVWLLPLGLWLQTLDHPVAVILQYYALFFLLLVPFVARHDRVVFGGAAVWAAVGAVVVASVLVVAPETTVRLGRGSPVVGDLLVTGYYPAVTWIGPMLFGLWLGRRDLGDPAVARLMVAGGLATLGVTTALGRGLASVLSVDPTRGSWAWLLSVDGHSEMPLAVVGAVGAATAVLGLSLAAAARWPTLTRPLADLGRVALSVYVGHLLVFDLVPGLLPADDVAEGIRTVLALTVVTSAGAVAWLSNWPRGPLETVARGVWARSVRPAVEAMRRAAAEVRGRRHVVDGRGSVRSTVRDPRGTASRRTPPRAGP